MDDKKRARLEAVREKLKEQGLYKKNKSVNLKCKDCGDQHVLTVNDPNIYTPEKRQVWTCWRCKDGGIMRKLKLTKIPKKTEKVIETPKKKVTKDIKNKVKINKPRISDLMKETLGKDQDYSFEKLLKEVKAKFPESKWDKAHYAWYKSQFKGGKL